MSQHMASLIQAKMSIGYLLSSLNKNFSLSFASQKEIGLDWSMHSLGLLVNYTQMMFKMNKGKGQQFFFGISKLLVWHTVL